MKAYTRITFVLMAFLLIVLPACGPMSAPTTEAYTPAPTRPGEQAYFPAPTMEAPVQTWDSYRPSTGGTHEPNDQPYGDVFFENYGVNPRIDTEDDHFSTFAVDVDTAAYTVMRRVVNDGYLPDKDSVRVEEYVNFFTQDYPTPDETAFGIHIDGAPSPYADNYHLVRIGIQGYEVSTADRPDVVLTFIIDVSGSMDMENRLGLVEEALTLLVEQLRPTDRVGIVTYGSRASVALEHTPVANSSAIFRAIGRLRTEGSTNAEEGLLLGYQLAREAFDPEAINRVILCSDGVANVGRTGPDAILAQIRDYAAQDIYLTTVGVGMGNYNDVLLERLANDGNGFYAYVDDIREAERIFVHNLPSTLQVIARDAKVQVEFNPAVVSRYRLIGYENRAIADEDFRNDAVDAGELGPGHSVTALYEVKFQPTADPWATALTVYLRWEDPESREVTEINRSIAPTDLAADFESSAPHFQLAVVVAQYAEVLRESYWATDAGVTLADVALEARRVARYFELDEDVQEFARLSWKAVEISPTR